MMNHRTLGGRGNHWFGLCEQSPGIIATGILTQNKTCLGPFGGAGGSRPTAPLDFHVLDDDSDDSDIEWSDDHDDDNDVGWVLELLEDKFWDDAFRQDLALGNARGGR